MYSSILTLATFFFTFSLFPFTFSLDGVRIPLHRGRAVTHPPTASTEPLGLANTPFLKTHLRRIVEYAAIVLFLSRGMFTLC